MNWTVENCCSICFEILVRQEKTIITEEILDLLNVLIQKINCKQLLHSPICEACLIKTQSASKLKILYLENLSKTDIKIEKQTDFEKCEICKNIISKNDTISLFDSLTESNKLTLSHYLSTELESKIFNNAQSCESCHKSLLNFCTITNLISTFDQDKISNISVINCHKEEYLRVDFDLNIADIKTEYTSQNIKEEYVVSEQGELQYNNEEIDTKMEYVEDLGINKIWEHIEETADIISPTNSPVTTSDETQQKKIRCPICKFEPKHKPYLKKHMLLHQTYANLKSYQCDICKFQTKSKVCLEKHMLTHKMSYHIEMYTCYNCTFRTKNKEELSQHMLEHKMAGDTEMYNCQLCEYSSKKKCELTKHVLSHKNVDEIEKVFNEKFQCHICSFRARHRYHLNSHMIIHMKDSEVVMFECEICKFQTKRSSSLKKHLLTHKNNDEVEMFKCPDCKYQTKRKDTLRCHMLVHKKTSDIDLFECNICQCKIKRKGDVKRHMLRHKNENEIEMYACQSCKYKTKRKGDIKKHMLIHQKDNTKEVNMMAA